MNKKINIINLLFYIGLTLIIFADMFNCVHGITNIIRYIRIMAMGFLFFVCILQSSHYYKKTIALIIISLLLVIISYYFSNDNYLLILFLLIFSAKNIKFKQLIKYDLVVKIIFILIVISLHNLGLTESFVLERIDGTLRNSMGFIHPNIFGAYILSVACDFVYLTFNKFKKINLVFLFILFLVVGHYSDSRTSQYCILFLLFFCCIWKIRHFFKRPIIEKSVKFLVSNSFIILTFITFLLVYLYRKNNMYILMGNQLLSNRILFASDFLDYYGIKLFGQEILMVATKESVLLGYSEWVLDNAYLLILLKYGVFVYCLFGYFFKKVFKMLFERKEIVSIVILFIYMLFGLMEQGMYVASFNIFILIIAEFIYHKKKKEIENV